MSQNVNADAVHVAIRRTIDEHDVVLFMKGEPSAPECGFSATVVKILDHLGIDFRAGSGKLDRALSGFSA